ncbi:nucleotide exchange factor GrpE [Undibacterium terreum]|uniref:Protein GrpE n=1 Tax=Undibacterium terreum TaxID=1224302 RepID=A0A916UQB0_9BURK|nr:nucleotide exchange factor GrpE [Undibacterium terreum]GGC83105.1 protein GrpE [Undibacterium terreum]
MQEQEKQAETINTAEQIVTNASATDAAVNSAPATDAATPVEAAPAVDVVAQLEAKVQELQDSFMRAKAEGENIRRRAQEDISKAHKFAIEGFAEAMVPVKDSLEMALKVETPSVESLKEGVEMTLRQLSAAFEKNRLTEISPQKGDKLDPMKHQAISMEPAEQEANTIVTVLQKGYTIADRLLRPALVTVAQGK